MSVTEVTIRKFQAVDGTIHLTQASAEARNSYLENKGLVDSFIVHAKLSAQQAGALRKLLPQFMSFMDTYVEPVAVAEVAAEAVEA